MFVCSLAWRHYIGKVFLVHWFWRGLDTSTCSIPSTKGASRPPGQGQLPWCHAPVDQTFSPHKNFAHQRDWEGYWNAIRAICWEKLGVPYPVRIRDIRGPVVYVNPEINCHPIPVIEVCNGMSDCVGGFFSHLRWLRCKLQPCKVPITCYGAPICPR